MTQFDEGTKAEADGTAALVEKSEVCGPYWLRVLATIVGGLSAGLDWCMIIAVMPVMAAAYPDSNFAMGLVIGCKYLGQLITNPIAAFLVHRIGPWPTGLIGLFGYAVSIASFGASEEYLGVLAFTMIVQGFCGGCLFNGTQEGMLRHYPKDEQTFAVSYGMVGLSFGLFLGPIYGGVIYDMVGFAWTFYILSIISLVLFGIGCVVTYNALYVYGIHGATFDPSDETTKRTEAEFFYDFFAYTLITLYENPKLLNVFINFSTEMGMWGVVMTIESFYLERSGWSATYTGLGTSIVSFFYGIMSLASGPIAKHFKPFIIAAPYPSLLVLGLLIPLIAVSASPIHICLMNIAYGLLTGTVELTSIYNYRIITHDAPIAFMLTDMSFCMGGTIGVIMADLLNDFLPSTLDALFVMGAIGFSVGTVCTIVAYRLSSSADVAELNALLGEAEQTKGVGKDKLNPLLDEEHAEAL